MFLAQEEAASAELAKPGSGLDPILTLLRVEEECLMGRGGGDGLTEFFCAVLSADPSKRLHPMQILEHPFFERLTQTYVAPPNPPVGLIVNTDS